MMVVKFLKSTVFYLVFLFCFLNTTCDDNDMMVDVITCDYEVLVNKTEYDNLNSDSFNFIEAEIVGDCLKLKTGASGCSGDSWEFKLVDSEAIAESLPEQRYLKFQLINKEECLAFFERTISFDLGALQINGSNELILNIEGLDEALSYKY